MALAACAIAALGASLAGCAGGSVANTEPPAADSRANDGDITTNSSWAAGDIATGVSGRGVVVSSKAAKDMTATKTRGVVLGD